jgi:hypothetical protein
MALLLTDAGESDMLSVIVNKTAPSNYVLRLYQSNTTPAETDTHTTYTEATFTGYSSVTLTGASWSIAGTAPTTASYAQQTFTSSAGSQSQNIYGYYVNRTTGNTIGWAERFSDGPYQITNNGDQIKVTPNFTLD